MSLGEPSRFAWLSTHLSSNAKTLLWTRGQQMQNDQGGVVNSTLVATMIREDVRLKKPSDCHLFRFEVVQFLYCKQIKVPYGSTAENPIEAPWFLWSCIDEDGGQAIQLSKQWSEQMLKNAEVGSASITDWKTTMIDSGTTCSLEVEGPFSQQMWWRRRILRVNPLSLDVSRNRSRYTYMNSGSYKLLARAVEEACSGGLPPANSPFPSLFTVPRSRRDQALWWYQVSERLLESSQRHQQRADLCSASRHQGLDQGFPFSEVSKHQSLLQLRGDEMGARSIPLQAWVESTLFI